MAKYDEMDKFGKAVFDFNTNKYFAFEMKVENYNKEFYKEIDYCVYIEMEGLEWKINELKDKVYEVKMLGKEKEYEELSNEFHEKVREYILAVKCFEVDLLLAENKMLKEQLGIEEE